MTGTELPRFVVDQLNACPRAGSGVHEWLFKTARVLHAFRSESEIASLLEINSVSAGRPIPTREINAAVADSKRFAWQPGQRGSFAGPGTTAIPKPNVDRIRAITADGPGLADLWESSPVRFDDAAQHSEEIIDALFPGNPLVCCGWSASSFDTKPREDWRGELGELQFIVPSPMRAVMGTTKEGTLSKHCLDNTGPRRFMVCEFDSGTFDEHAAILHRLGRYAPFVLAVQSGGKSLHGWFLVRGWSEDSIGKFIRNAAALGADPAPMRNRSQFVRMPDGTRDNGRRQTVFYFDPSKCHE